MIGGRNDSNISLKLLLTGAMFFDDSSRGQTITVRIPETAIKIPAKANPGNCLVINNAPISTPTELPTVVPADIEADIVPRKLSGTRSDNVDIAGAIIIFRPNMAKQ